MSHSPNIVLYFLQAGFVVKGIMLLLMLTSVASWALIVQRSHFFRTLQRETARFNRRFHAASDLHVLYADVARYPGEQAGLAGIFYAGFKELLHLNQQKRFDALAIQRRMQIRQAQEVQHLEHYLPFFASVGAIAPFVGLFGTVWGIMASLQALGQAHQATIAMVAPGISEALVATALGLFTAIPAALAYNRYTALACNLSDNFSLFQAQLMVALEDIRQ